MKAKITMSAALAALMGISGVALADTVSQFTPVENLMPDQRQAVFESLSQMTNVNALDWDHIAIGVDENSQIVILQKDVLTASSGPCTYGKTTALGIPSSFGTSAATGSPSSFKMPATGSPSSYKMKAEVESAE